MLFLISINDSIKYANLHPHASSPNMKIFPILAPTTRLPSPIRRTLTYFSLHACVPHNILPYPTTKNPP
jgi:hypothetical protein